MALFVPAAMLANVTAASGETTYVLTPTIVSQYVFRGQRLGGLSVQPMLESTTGGLVLGVWANEPVRARVAGQSDPEIDPYGSYKIAVNERLSVQPGFTWYTYPRADRLAGYHAMTFEPNLAINYTWSGVTLTPKLYYDLTTNGPTAELNAAYALPVAAIGTELDFNASIGTYRAQSALTAATSDVKEWGNYWSAGVTMPYQITRTSRLALGFGYSQGSGAYLKRGTEPKFANPKAVGRGVVSLSYSVSF